MGTQRDSRGKGSEVGRKGVHVAQFILAQFLQALPPFTSPWTPRAWERGARPLRSSARARAEF